MPDFANVIASTPGAIPKEDAHALRGALATGAGPQRKEPLGAAGMREAARRLKEARAVDGEGARQPAANHSLFDWTTSH